MSQFQQLANISRLAAHPGSESQARDAFIRFLNEYDGWNQIAPAVDAMAIRLGLFPYVDAAPAELSEQHALAVAYHSPISFRDKRFTFHREQQHIYERLLDGESLVLSAPTSFGKSAIIDALVLAQRWRNIVLIVPTIALIDETRRRIASLGSPYVIISHPSQVRGEVNIFVLTQERYLELSELIQVDLFIIDEFYKLGSGGLDDQRRATLNIAWRQLRSTGAQYYLIGPNISSIDPDVDPEVRDRMVVSDFNTVVVDVEDRSSRLDQIGDLKHFLGEEAGGPTLIFVGVPKRAAELAEEIAVHKSEDPLVQAVASWIGEHYDPEWFVVSALRGGVGTHTGPMPRSLQRAMVRLFEMGKLQSLVCTSTLIEGVNTVAKNVVIFEKKIDQKPIDYFTFSNIRGRAGRMLKHFVGRVVSYSPPPESVASEVDIPIESQSNLASLATLVQLPVSELSDHSRERLAETFEQRILSLKTIRGNKGLDPDRQIRTASAMMEWSKRDFNNISWTGAPNYEQLLAVVKLGYDHLLSGRQRQGVNPKSILAKLSAVRENAGDIPQLVEKQWRYRHPGQSRSEVVDDVLSFQRNWMGFVLPSMFRALSSIQAEVAAGIGGAQKASYEFELREIESLFLPPFMSDLEDYGLPLPIALKLSRLGLRGDSIEEVVARLAQMARTQSIVSQLTRVERWFLSDVASGLAKELRV